MFLAFISCGSNRRNSLYVSSNKKNYVKRNVFIEINRNVIDCHGHGLRERNNLNANPIVGGMLVLETKHINYIYRNVI